MADENVSTKLVLFLKEKGYDVKYADKGLRNSILLDVAQKEKRILLTHDTDFANTILYPPERFWGIIVFRLHPPTLDKLKKAITAFIAEMKGQDLVGNLAVVEEERVILKFSKS